MGSTVRFNDTLQITEEQGFPSELNIATYLKSSILADLFIGKKFKFIDKPGIRNFQQEPVVNFLVQNQPTSEGQERHIYWGHITILSVTHDYEQQTTSGEFKIIKIFTPEEMKIAPLIIGLSSDKDFFLRHITKKSTQANKTIS